MEFRTAVVAALIILSILLFGCASLIEKGKLPDVVARHPPDIQLGSELILLEEPPILASGLIDEKGLAHIFVVDQARQLCHIEIIGDKIITREFLSNIETKQAIFLDTTEHPPGKLRILAGDKQYFQVAPNLEWQEIKGNRCARFVHVDDELFCAFVIKGEEIEAPERTDYTFGWFFLLPIVYWSHEYASKLVLAEESSEGWIIRAVVDPDITMDADRDFMIGTDRLGNIHVLYSTSKGGGAFIVFAYGYGGGAETSKQKHELRYAQLKLDQLLVHSKETQNQLLNNNSTLIKWMSIKGVSLEQKPFRKKDYDYLSPIVLKPLNRRFAVNKATGNVDGLIWTGQCPMVDTERKLPVWMYNPTVNPSIVEVSIHNGQWASRFDIVATKDFPTSGIMWRYFDNLSIKLDGEGKYHLLLQSLDPGWKNRKYMNYLLKADEDWSAPLTLGRSHLTSDVISLAVGDSGVAFAAWVNEEGDFIGRWIRPHSINHK